MNRLPVIRIETVSVAPKIYADTMGLWGPLHTHMAFL
jgi:hypothetical protein